MQLSTTQRSEDRQAELTAAFNAFGSVSEQLADAFDSLRLQVANLRGELREARAGNEHLAGRLSALLQALPAGVLVLGADGHIQQCNPAALELLGEPVLGLSFSALLARAAVNSN